MGKEIDRMKRMDSDSPFPAGNLKWEDFRH